MGRGFSGCAHHDQFEYDLRGATSKRDGRWTVMGFAGLTAV